MTGNNMTYEAYLAVKIRIKVLFSYPSLLFSDGIKVATTKMREQGWVKHKRQ